MLWSAHIIGALLLGFGLRFLSDGKMLNKIRPKKIQPVHFGSVLSGGIKNAMETMVFVGGTIIFFCAAARLVTMAAGENGLLVGLLEATNGVSMLAAMPTPYAVAMAAAVISFGGLSVHVQSIHFLSKTDIHVGQYLICKSLHALIAAGFCILFYSYPS
jgi:hypothetical protein